MRPIDRSIASSATSTTSGTPPTVIVVVSSAADPPGRRNAHKNKKRKKTTPYSNHAGEPGISYVHAHAPFRLRRLSDMEAAVLFEIFSPLRDSYHAHQPEVIRRVTTIHRPVKHYPALGNVALPERTGGKDKINTLGYQVVEASRDRFRGLLPPRLFVIDAVEV